MAIYLKSNQTFTLRRNLWQYYNGFSFPFIGILSSVTGNIYEGSVQYMVNGQGLQHSAKSKIDEL